MTLSVFAWIFLIASNIFEIYMVYIFNGLFYDKTGVSRRKEIIVYTALFALSLLRYYYMSPLFVLVLEFIIFFFSSMLYKENIFKRMSLVLYLHSSAAAISCISMYICMISEFNHNYSDVFSSEEKMLMKTFISQLLMFVLITLSREMKGIRINKNIPSKYWLAASVVPIASLYIMEFITIQGTTNNLLQKLLAVVILLIMLVAPYFVFSVFAEGYSDKVEVDALKQQNQSYLNQLQIIQDMYNNVRSARHDLKNHMNTIRILAENNEIEKIHNYVDNYSECIMIDEVFSKTGNIEIDSIINFKLCQAKNKGINVTTDIKIPEKSPFPSIDASIILGNLLDNAIEAAEKCETKEIVFKLISDTSVIKLDIKNTFSGDIIREGNSFKTTKEDTGDNHGLGISNVIKIIKKYDGVIDFSNDDKYFYVSVFAYKTKPV